MVKLMNLDNIIEDLPSEETPLIKVTFEKICNAILDNIYPIGRGFIDFTGKDYSNYLGMKWERELVNLTPIGCDASGSNIGTTKGTETHKHSQGATFGHKLIVDELPKHSFNIYLDKYPVVNGAYPGVEGWEALNQYSANVNGDTLKTNSIGEDKEHTHNNPDTNTASSYQPSKVVAYWKRVA